MTRSNRWQLLDQLTADHFSDLPAAIYAELAERLREAIGDRDPAPLHALARQLHDVLNAAAHKVAPEAMAAARRQAEAVPASRDAFALGQLGFAHQLAEGMASKRAEAGFEELLTSPTFLPYVQALQADDMTGVALAEHMSQWPETVSRNLKKLRDMGAVDFRREGTSFINFLTPAARGVIERERGRIPRARLAPSVQAWARNETRDMAEIMRDAPNFAREQEMTKGRDVALAD